MTLGQDSGSKASYAYYSLVLVRREIPYPEVTG